MEKKKLSLEELKQVVGGSGNGGSDIEGHLVRDTPYFKDKNLTNQAGLLLADTLVYLNSYTSGDQGTVFNITTKKGNKRGFVQSDAIDYGWDV